MVGGKSSDAKAAGSAVPCGCCCCLQLATAAAAAATEQPYMAAAASGCIHALWQYLSTAWQQAAEQRLGACVRLQHTRSEACGGCTPVRVGIGVGGEARSQIGACSTDANGGSYSLAPTACTSSMATHSRVPCGSKVATESRQCIKANASSTADQHTTWPRIVVHTSPYANQLLTPGSPAAAA
jgi:hypothetical protein